jgi:hypothetical protein
MQRISEGAAALLVAAAAAVLAACGSDEPATAVAGANHPPEIRELRLLPERPVAGDRLRAEVAVRDQDGDPVETRFAWTVDGAPRDESGAELVLTSARRGAVVEVAAVASDGLRESDPSRASVTVANRAPTLDSVRIEPWEKVAPGQQLSVSAAGSDPDGDPVDYEFQWRVNGAPIDHAGTELATDDLASGDLVVVRAWARDGDAKSAPIESAAVRVVGANPEIVSTPAGYDGRGTFRYRVEAVHPDGDRSLRFALREAPEGMRVDPLRGEVSWTPRSDQTGTFTVAVAVEDSRGAVTVQEFDLVVGLPEPASIAP